jgi:hypothetical protein
MRPRPIAVDKLVFVAVKLAANVEVNRPIYRNAM